MTNRSQHHHDHGHDADLAEMLDRDALLQGDHLEAIVAWAASQQPTSSLVADLGAGTGSGALALARALPRADVVAVDQSAFMLEHVAAAAEARQLSDRITTMQVDLDADWPDLADVDLVWAASSMHHMSDPGSVLERIERMLAPDGLLVVVELDALPRHLPDDLGFGAPGLEQRLHDAAAGAGWNAHPDWASSIRAAGMRVVERRTFAFAADGSPSLIAQSASAMLSRLRDGVAGSVSPDDLADLDALLRARGPRSLAARTDLTVRGSRTAWAARPAR